MISLCQQRELTAKWEAEHQCPAMACGVPPVRVNEHIRSLWPCKTVNAGSTCCQHTQHWRTDVCSFKSHCSTSCLFLGCLEQQTAAGTRSRLTWWDTEIKQGVWFPDVGEEHMVPPSWCLKLGSRFGMVGMELSHTLPPNHQHQRWRMKHYLIKEP